MKKSTIWLAFDLGVRGDYEGLYAWLDAHGAKECGDSVAVLTYRYPRSLTDTLKTELQKAFSVDKRTRLYVVYRSTETGKNKGSFLFGGRRAAAWSGYATSSAGATDNEV